MHFKINIPRGNQENRVSLCSYKETGNKPQEIKWAKDKREKIKEQDGAARQLNKKKNMKTVKRIRKGPSGNSHNCLNKTKRK